MSKRPPKKSEPGKSWRKGRRAEKTRIAALERHLVVCEGKMTEPLYFEGLKAALAPEHQRKIQIVVEGTGLHTLDLLAFARREQERSYNGFDHIWIAYDKDEFSSEEFDDVARECQAASAEAVKYHALWSNPCMEVWFLLHFVETTAELTARECQHRLASEFSKGLSAEYEKNDPRTYSRLLPMLPAARKRAEGLLKHHGSEGRAAPSLCNPGTNVQSIFTQLEGYMGERRLEEA